MHKTARFGHLVMLAYIFYFAKLMTPRSKKCELLIQLSPRNQSHNRKKPPRVNQRARWVSLAVQGWGVTILDTLPLIHIYCT